MPSSLSASTPIWPQSSLVGLNVIIGGTQGIGLGIARVFTAFSADILISGRGSSVPTAAVDMVGLSQWADQ